MPDASVNLSNVAQHVGKPTRSIVAHAISSAAAAIM